MPPVAEAMNLQSTLPFDAALQIGVAGGGGLPSTLYDTLSAGMLVVAVDVVAVEDVVVVAGMLVVVVATDVVAIEDVVVTTSGLVSLPPPQPVAAKTIAAISVARRCRRHANPWVPEGAIIVSSVRKRWRTVTNEGDRDQNLRWYTPPLRPSCLR